MDATAQELVTACQEFVHQAISALPTVPPPLSTTTVSVPPMTSVPPATVPATNA